MEYRCYFHFYLFWKHYFLIDEALEPQPKLTVGSYMCTNSYKNTGIRRIKGSEECKDQKNCKDQRDQNDQNQEDWKIRKSTGLQGSKSRRFKEVILLRVKVIIRAIFVLFFLTKKNIFLTLFYQNFYFILN